MSTNTLVEQLGAVWKAVKGTPAEMKRSIQIPHERVHDSGPQQPRLTPEKLYLSLIVNEMFLTESRQWHNVYDPMALVVTEFVYNGKPIVMPFVVGPSLLEGKVEKVPNGIAITDTHVAGLHPYQGGRFAVTMILAQIKRDWYAKRLLQVVENVGSAFPLGVAVDPYLKVSSAVLDGVESLFGMGDTKALVGHRWEFDPGTTPWLEPGFFLLTNTSEDRLDAGKLSVSRGRLVHADDSPASDQIPKVRQFDYLLYSLMAPDRRTDIASLPFYPLFQTALRDATSADEGAWPRAKAALLTLYQTLVTSPDVTWDEAHDRIAEFTEKVVAAHEKAGRFSVLSGHRRTERVEGETGDEVRQQRLRELHKILELP